MTIYTFKIANPPAGSPWTWTVPGQYVATLLGASATLVPLGNPTFAIDSSGNGHDATYFQVGKLAWGVTGPYAGSPNRAVRSTATTSDVVDIAEIATPTTAFNPATITVGAWVNLSVGVINAAVLWSASNTGGGGSQKGWRLGVGSFTPAIEQLNWQAFGFFSGGSIARGAWHHVAATSDGVNVVLYVDGVNVASSAVAATIQNLAYPVDIGGFASGGANSPYVGDAAGLFVCGSALSGATISGLVAAAATSSAAYKAAVLATAPIALWMLDEVSNTNQRTPILTITDGTSVVSAFPAPSPVATSGTFTWSWLADGSGTNQTPSQSVTIVAIPKVTLDPGYTVGVTVPDGGTSDQWSNVVVWADIADSGQGSPGGGGLAPYQNVRIMG